MEVNELLISYLSTQSKDKDSIIEIAKENALYFITADFFGVDLEKNLSFAFNKFRYNYILKKCMEIQSLFDLSNIKAIMFKGIVLSNRLYDKAQKRYVGDIDIFVEKEEFSAALTLLIRSGYNFRDKKTFYNEHHIVLVRDDITIELHKTIFNPILGINEKYFINNLVEYTFLECTIKTFDVTATIMHLIYHLYQDTYWSHYSLHSILTNQRLPETKRFLYRAYEIALFSEKFYNEIKWGDIVDDLKHQQLRVFFKKMIYDVIRIFPKAFPESYLQTVQKKTYIDDEHDVWCKRLLESNCPQKDLGFILSSFIDDYWSRHADQNIHLKVGEGFTLNNPNYKEKDDYDSQFACEVYTNKSHDDLILTFTVSNNDFCFTEKTNYDTTASDGIHLLLFGTEEYSYNSFYIFPKIENGQAKAVVIDVKKSERVEIDRSYVDTICKCTDDTYIITVILKRKFLQDNQLSNYLYLGLIVVDCSTKTNKRRAELVLTNDYNEWYNPVYFARIDIC